MIYLDNAATTKPCSEAIAAFHEAISEYGNPSSAHELGQRAAAILYSARKDIAQCLSARPDEIFFTSCGSESDTMAILTAAEIGIKAGKRHIISQQTEHHAVLNCLNALEKRGFRITLLPVDGEGSVSVDEVERAMCSDTALVTVMTANNEIGTIQPIEKIGKICRQKNVLFHTDSVQAAGHIPLNVNELNCDMLSISAHKFHGLKGAGALYIRRNIPVSTLIFGGNQERGKRGGTENLPAIAAMAAALKVSTEHLEKECRNISTLRDMLIEGLAVIPTAHLNGSRYNRLCGNVSFCFENASGEELVSRLSHMGIYVGSGSACAVGNPNPSHVMLAIGRSPELAKGAVRLSLSRYTTEEEIQKVVKAFHDLIHFA